MITKFEQYDIPKAEEITSLEQARGVIVQNAHIVNELLGLVKQHEDRIIKLEKQPSQIETNMEDWDNVIARVGKIQLRETQRLFELSNQCFTKLIDMSITQQETLLGGGGDSTGGSGGEPSL